MSETINGYNLVTHFSNKNAGSCQWAFADRDGKHYFIKQLLFPKYPTEATKSMLSPSIVNAMLAEANEFYVQRKRFYDKLLECRTGNVAVVQDFFRSGEFYYIVTERVLGPFLKFEQIAGLSDEKKRTLIKSILYSIMFIHDRGIVHSDLKPENIIIKETYAGFCTSKLIDFEASYFEYEIPEEIVGDQRYFSPEAILKNDSRDVHVGVKSDIFALGLILHQLWCGTFPVYDRTEYDSASIALLNHSVLTLSPKLPPDIRQIIARMLAKYQENRPSARELWTQFSGEHKDFPRTTVTVNTGFHMPTDDEL